MLPRYESAVNTVSVKEVLYHTLSLAELFVQVDEAVGYLVCRSVVFSQVSHSVCV